MMAFAQRIDSSLRATMTNQPPAKGDLPAEPATDRVRVRRKPERGRYDRATIHAILDAGLVAHVGFVLDGRP